MVENKITPIEAAARVRHQQTLKMLNASGIKQGLARLATQVPGSSIEVHTLFNPKEPEIPARAVLHGPIDTVISDGAFGAKIVEKRSKSLYFIPNPDAIPPHVGVWSERRYKRVTTWPDELSRTCVQLDSRRIGHINGEVDETALTNFKNEAGLMEKE